MATGVILPERLDYAAATSLRAMFLAQRGGDFDVDASLVTHLGTLCLQVLLSAARDCAGTGHRFRLVSPSEQCSAHLALHGLSPETLNGNPI
jgi:chemotaxis protein CheX